MKKLKKTTDNVINVSEHQIAEIDAEFKNLARTLMKDRLAILQEIFEHFQMITQELSGNFDEISNYHYKAEGLVEILEVKDCGSIKGHDSKNPCKNITGYKLYDRFLTLVRKNRTERLIDKSCYFTLANMTKYFKTISKLREKFNK